METMPDDGREGLAQTICREQANLVEYLRSRGEPMGTMAVVLAVTLRVVGQALGESFEQTLDLFKSTESLGPVCSTEDEAG